MASADLLKSLFRSFKQGNDELFYAIAQEIITEEKKKKHNALARDLQLILENGNSKAVSTPSIYDFEKLPKDKERGTTLLEIRRSDRLLADIILNEETKSQLEVVIKEYSAIELFSAYGLRAKQKLLFAGPPGCGKTLCAEVLSSELGLPILYIRFDAVISSYLGETANNLRKIFDFASRGTWIVFFDEFDAIGKSRDNSEEHGELKRVVNTFLQLLDSFASESIFIAATNHEQLLDRALWRRFDDILFFAPPSKNQILEVIRLKLRNFPHTLNYEDFATQMIGWSYADVERVCTEAMKISLFEDKTKIDDAIFLKSVEYQKRRIDIIRRTTEPKN